MNLNLNRITEKISQNDIIKSFIKELNEALEKYNYPNEMKGEKMDDIKLTGQEELEYYRKEVEFLQDYFSKELSDLSKGEIFIVTNKYENDYKYHRYKVAQYKDNKEYKYIALEKDLPKNVKLRDVVRKINGKYVYDEQATQYVNDALDEIKQAIVGRR